MITMEGTKLAFYMRIIEGDIFFCKEKLDDDLYKIVINDLPVYIDDTLPRVKDIQVRIGKSHVNIRSTIQFELYVFGLVKSVLIKRIIPIVSNIMNNLLLPINLVHHRMDVSPRYYGSAGGHENGTVDSPGIVVTIESNVNMDLSEDGTDIDAYKTLVKDIKREFLETVNLLSEERVVNAFTQYKRDEYMKAIDLLRKTFGVAIDVISDLVHDKSLSDIITIRYDGK